MRNLKIVDDSTQSINSHLPITSQTWDVSSDSIIFTLGPSPSQQLIELRRVPANARGTEDQTTLIASWDALCPLPDLDCDQVLDLHHSAHTDTTCLVLLGGDIINVRHNPLPGEDRIEIVGSVDEGITAAAWSPDEELLVLITRANTFLFMTVDFENLANLTLTAEDAKLSKHVSVGWGKAETQFKGKRAKALRDPTVPEKIDEGILSAHDQAQTSISWRGDGAFVAVNSIIEEGPRRMIRIYTREGVLDSVTEPVDGLEGALSWRPEGNLLAGLQRFDDKMNVVFFERNGLRHGHFPLRMLPEDMNDWASAVELSWNIDSSALAVSFADRVQIWTMNNYHYYLKQEICGTPAAKPRPRPINICWHPEEALRLNMLCHLATDSHMSGHPSNHQLEALGSENDYICDSAPKRQLRSISLVPTVSRGSLTPPNDFGIVIVIDGKTIKITPLRKSNVPPPMALHDLELGSPVVDVAVNSTSTKLAALHQGQVTLINYDANNATQEPQVEKVVNLPDLLHNVTRQISFHEDASCFVLGTDRSNGAPLNYNLAKKQFVSKQLVELGDLFLIAKGVVQSSSMIINDENVSVTLKSNGGLFANDRHLVKNCTSFLATPSHTMFTTTNHLLKFIHLNASAEDLQVPPDEPETDERCRNIERGAKLVTAMPSAYSVVLQMPRGNLETIYPRALVLASIRRKINDKQYRKAFLTCRSQRVDMNIIHDYAPQQFLSDVWLIIKQLKSVEYIDLLLSQLNDANVSKTLYRETLPVQHDKQSPEGTGVTSFAPDFKDDPQSGSSSGKVNRVCDAFLSVLKGMYATNLQNVITANVCKIPANIEAGLEVVASLREKDEAQAEAALEHMCFLTDVNRIYDRALGVYDLDLTLMVAQQSQKDPREYLPYLQTLQNMELLRRKFTVDNDLKYHAKALTHLHALNAFEELKSYTQQHTLYTQALDLYRYDPTRWRTILRLQADHLTSRNHFLEAGIAYESLSDLPSALTSYTSAATWRSALTVATIIPLPPEELTALATSLRDTAIEGKDHTAAATISSEYLDDTPSAVTHLCRANKVSEALRLASRAQSSNPTRHAHILTETFDPCLAEAAASLTELLADCKAQALAQTTRLAEVRRIKAEDPLRFMGGEARAGTADQGDVPDDISLATGTSVNPSLFTRYSRTTATGTALTGDSRKTSKNARREERKRARGKKGSIYEEEYLVASFGRLVERVNDCLGDCAEVVGVCCRRGGEGWERGRALERGVQEARGVLGERVGWVFEVAKGVEGEGEGGEEKGGRGKRPMGGEGVLWDVIEGRGRGEVPVVKEFGGLSLLA